MSAKPRMYIVAVFAIAFFSPLFGSERAQAQTAKPQQRLAAIQQQNALQQQQNAVQAALQQTTSLLQSSTRQSTNSQQFTFYNVINLQQQQSALQIAMQQTNALLQSSYRNNNGLNELALRQLNALQNVVQQSSNLQSAVPAQNGQLTSYQFNTLVQQQNALMGLLTAQAPPSPRGSYRK